MLPAPVFAGTMPAFFQKTSYHGLHPRKIPLIRPFSEYQGTCFSVSFNITTLNPKGAFKCERNSLRTSNGCILPGSVTLLRSGFREAAGDQLSPLEFLELVLQDEITMRNDRAFAKRIKAAQFRDLKTIEDFDFTFNPSIKRKQIMDLAAGHFIRQHQDVLLIGPPGVGKSHLAQGLGYQASKMGFTVFYRSIFTAVSELMQAEAMNETAAKLKRYLAPEVLII